MSLLLYSLLACDSIEELNFAFPFISPFTVAILLYYFFFVSRSPACHSERSRQLSIVGGVEPDPWEGAKRNLAEKVVNGYRRPVGRGLVSRREDGSD